jgi:hypothetical protein
MKKVLTLTATAQPVEALANTRIVSKNNHAVNLTRPERLTSLATNISNISSSFLYFCARPILVLPIGRKY